MPHYATLQLIAGLPNLLRPFITSLLHHRGEQRLAHISAGARNGGLDYRTYHDLTADLLAFQQLHTNFMRASNLDALILPVTALPAFTHQSSKDLTPSLSYCFLFNLLRWPAGSVPVTKVRESEARYEAHCLPPNQRDTLGGRAAAQLQGAAGLPIGVQVATMCHEDELCLHVMRELEKALAKGAEKGEEEEGVMVDREEDGGREDGDRGRGPAMARMTAAQAAAGVVDRRCVDEGLW